jgi:hypothetical protein
MGYAFVFSACIGCGHVFGYNPHKVPSCSAVTGEREPICRVCVERVNPQRIKNGLLPIRPLPGAYEPIEEGEL